METRMRNIFLFAVSVLLLYLPANTHGFSSRGEDCSKCHALKKEEAVSLLQGILPNVRVLGIRPAPMKSVWEVVVESGDKKGPVYIDFSKKYVLLGSLIDIKGKRNLSEERSVELNKVDVSKIPLKDALVLGDRGAKKKVIVFDDPD
jgi:thiol:disulfide interchange protein DsbC